MPLKKSTDWQNITCSFSLLLPSLTPLGPYKELITAEWHCDMREDTGSFFSEWREYCCEGLITRYHQWGKKESHDQKHWYTKFQRARERGLYSRNQTNEINRSWDCHDKTAGNQSNILHLYLIFFCYVLVSPILTAHLCMEIRIRISL